MRPGILLFSLLFWSHSGQWRVRGAHSRRRLVLRTVPEPRYDRSITTFDPSGRMLQVEYGAEASNRGDSIVALWLEKQVVLVLVLHNPAVSSTFSSSSSLIGGTTSASSLLQKVHRIDDHLWLFTAGLSGDARFMATQLRYSCQQHRLAYGEPMTAQQAATAMADLQHELTRTAGARPLACTAILVGTDPATTTTTITTPSSSSTTTTSLDVGEWRIFRSGPGGVLEDCLYCCAGKDHDAFMNALGANYKHEIQTSASLATAATYLTRRIMELLEIDHPPSARHNTRADLWIFQSKAGRRGKAHVRCLLDFGKAISDPDSVAKYFEPDNPTIEPIAHGTDEK